MCLRNDLPSDCVTHTFRFSEQQRKYCCYIDCYGFDVSSPARRVGCDRLTQSDARGRPGTSLALGYDV